MLRGGNGVTERIVLVLGVQLVQAAQTAFGLLKRPAAGLFPGSGIARRIRLRGEPGKVALHDFLDITRHDALIRAVRVMHEMRLGLIARVADQPVAGLSPFLVAHFRAAVPADEQAGQQLSAFGSAGAVRAVQTALRTQPCFAVDERLMAAGIALALVDDDARVALAVENLPHEMLVAQTERPGDAPGGLAGEIPRVNLAHGVRVAVRHENALRRVVVVAERYFAAARPESLPDALDHAHARAEKDVFALKLRKGGQNADHGAAVGCSGVDVLVDGHEIHAVRRENVLDEIERVFLTAAQAVELVDNDTLDLAVSDAVDELRHGRAVKARTGKAAVHIPRKAADALHAAVGFELFGLRRERISLVGLRLGRNAQI